MTVGEWSLNVLAPASHLIVARAPMESNRLPDQVHSHDILGLGWHLHPDILPFRVLTKCHGFSDDFWEVAEINAEVPAVGSKLGSVIPRLSTLRLLIELN